MDIVNALSLVLTFVSVAFAAWVFYVNSKREMIKKTLDYWEVINQAFKQEKREIASRFGGKLSTDDAQVISEDPELRVKVHRVLNNLERLAVGVNLKAYDLATLNRLVGRRIIVNYYWLEAYIVFRRETKGREYAWKDFERMKNRLEKLRRDTVPQDDEIVDDGEI